LKIKIHRWIFKKSFSIFKIAKVKNPDL